MKNYRTTESRPVKAGVSKGRKKKRKGARDGSKASKREVSSCAGGKKTKNPRRQSC